MAFLRGRDHSSSRPRSGYRSLPPLPGNLLMRFPPPPAGPPSLTGALSRHPSPPRDERTPLGRRSKKRGMDARSMPPERALLGQFRPQRPERDGAVAEELLQEVFCVERLPFELAVIFLHGQDLAVADVGLGPL